MELNNILQENKDFVESVQIFLSKPKYGYKYSDLFQDGLEVFIKSPIADSCSLFLINDEDFNLEHRLTIPAKEENNHQEILDIFIDKDIIGTTLHSGEVYYFKNNEIEDIDKEFLVIPLVVSWGITGIVILQLNNNSVHDVIDYMTIFKMHAGLFSSAIERFQLFSNLKNTKEILDQSVAIRTKNYVDKEDDLKNIINFLDIGILVIDENNKIILKNPYLKRIYGINLTDSLNENNILELKDLSNKNINNRFITDSKNNKIPVISNISNIKLKNNPVKIISVLDIRERKIAEDALLKLNNELEEIVTQRTKDLELSVSKLEKEVVNRKKAEDEIRHLFDKEKELNSLKTKFVQTVSHELRTPLTVIRSTAQLLELYDEKLNAEDKKKYLNRILNTVDSLTDIIQNVNIVESEDKSDKKSIIELEAISTINKCIEEINSKQNKKNIFVIESEFDEVYFEFSDESFQSILNNIIGNSIKFSKTGSKITIKIDKDDEDFILIVEDEGIGIPANNLDKIYDAFYRGDNVGAISGSGLGLNVVKSLLNDFKANIEVESEIDKGTKVTLNIPIKYEK